MPRLLDEISGKYLECRVLPRAFFLPQPEIVARALLGRILARRNGDGWLAGRIVETEAYLGAEDPAAHAFAGKTQRNAVLFGPPGHAYIYSIYGLHHCLNVSCQPNSIAGCVLIRALEPVAGIAIQRENRGLPPDAAVTRIASGPGKLCIALGVTRTRDNGIDLTAANSSLCLLEDEYLRGEVASGPRVGITKAAHLPLRFFLAGNACVSRR